jgi:hypothetical protein
MAGESFQCAGPAGLNFERGQPEIGRLPLIELG